MWVDELQVTIIKMLFWARILVGCFLIRRTFCYGLLLSEKPPFEAIALVISKQSTSYELTLGWHIMLIQNLCTNKSFSVLGVYYFGHLYISTITLCTSDTKAVLVLIYFAIERYHWTSNVCDAFIYSFCKVLSHACGQLLQD